ncbi:MAG: efflux RND transporter periplasmic adaptor subunit [Steroidobacteraceae bacterium]
MKLAVLICVLAAGLAACGGHTESTSADEHGGSDMGGESAKGEHGGRWLEQNGFAVELAIAETGAPPRLRAWLYRDGEPLPPTEGRIEVKLLRLGGVAEHHLLEPQTDGSLIGPGSVVEPHSFDVEVTARIAGQALQWSYASYEGRTTIEAQVAERAGIRVSAAGPGTIADEHVVQGLLTPIEGRVANAMARFPGPIRRLSANVGDSVRAGQSLAAVESNLSLTTYEITAPIAGVILARHAAVGTVASEAMPIYEIADLSALWVDLHIFGADAQHIRAGAPVEVTRLSDSATTVTRLERVLPGTATASQSTVARATIGNADGLWRPGSAVRARITVDREAVALAVPLAALQTFREWTVVYIRVGDIYEVRPVQLGKRDATHVQILSGINPGDLVVVEQSYLVKADIEKSGASHDH